jgi:DNA-binding MarR family transcriptional regulator
MSLEQLDPPARLQNPGRTAAWLAKQVELGLASTDLSLSQYRILGVLAEGSAMSSSLAERLAVRPPSVTAVIDGLVTRGLVIRTHSEDDRRRIALELTPDGRSLLDTADEAVVDRLKNIASGLGPKAAGKAIDSLSLWSDALYAHWAARAGR